VTLKAGSLENELGRTGRTARPLVEKSRFGGEISSGAASGETSSSPGGIAEDRLTSIICRDISAIKSNFFS